MPLSLTERFASALNRPEPEVGRTLALLVRAMTWTLDETRALRLPGLGVFSVFETSGRMLGRNPKTGEPIKVPAGKTVLFCHDEGEGREGWSVLVGRVAASLEYSLDEARRVSTTLVAVMKAALADAGEVEIPAFGTIRAHTNPVCDQSGVFSPDTALTKSLRMTSELPPELRPPRSTWKSVSELTPEDFEAHPVWGFDLGRGESAPGADETFVRPYDLVETRSGFSDTYFARARVTPRSGESTTGSLSFHFDAGDAILDRLQVHGTGPFEIPLGVQAVGPMGAAAMEPFRDRFPLRYEAHVKAEDGTVVDLVGEIDPFRPEPAETPDPDAFDLREGLERLLWTDDEAAVRRRYPGAKSDSSIAGIPVPMPMVSIGAFLEVEGVALDATVFFGPRGIMTVSISPPLGGPERDLTKPAATLARRLGCRGRLRSLNRWMSGGCMVDLSTHGGGHITCILRPPSFLPNP